jgi:hypothetical protein
MQQNPTPVLTSGGNIHAFFKDRKTISIASSSNSPKAIDAFQLPVSPDLQRLTKSQRIFSIATRTDIRSLTISGDIEFYLFMQLRAERGWASFKMTSHKWVAETAEFNARLEKCNAEANRQTIQKNPRALLDKLLAIEIKVMDRIATNNYKCEYLLTVCVNEVCVEFDITAARNSETFWKAACAAVPLVKTEDKTEADAKVSNSVRLPQITKLII